jgi:hypothetical protein
MDFVGTILDVRKAGYYGGNTDGNTNYGQKTVSPIAEWFLRMKVKKDINNFLFFIKFIDGELCEMGFFLAM